MSEEVYWLLEAEIKSGADEFRALMNDMVSATRANEPGTLIYEWSTNAEGTICHIYEHYADSAAALTHMNNFGKQFAGRFVKILRPVRWDIYGSPNEGVKKALAAFNPRYMESIGGFSR